MGSDIISEPSIVRWFTFERLLNDAERKRYDRIRRLYAASGIRCSSEDFLSLLNEKRACGDVPLCDSIFEDMCYVIAEKLSEGGPLLALFEELFDGKYLHVDASPKIIGLANENWHDFRHGGYIDVGLKDVSFRDAEPVYESRAFRSYVRARRQGMADYLHIEESELNSFLHQNLRPLVRIDEEKDEELEYFTHKNIYFGTAYLTLVMYLESRGGAAEWIREILSPKNDYLEFHGIRRRGFEYEPDIDNLIEQYCRGKVRVVQMKYGELTRPMLRTECVPLTALEDIEAISFLYYLDVVFEMLRRVRYRYYREFSFETFSGETQEAGYSSAISEFKKINESQAEKIRELRESLHMKSEEQAAAVLESERAHMQEIKALRTILQERDEEILRLKERLAWQEALTYAVENDISENVTDIDVAIIRTKRYLFVGYPEALAELRREFPTSIFMTSETSTRLRDIQVDAVVVLTRYIKHRTYYKIRSEKNLDGVPLIYCNKSASLDNVYAAIWKAAEKLSLK